MKSNNKIKTSPPKRAYKTPSGILRGRIMSILGQYKASDEEVVTKVWEMEMAAYGFELHAWSPVHKLFQYIQEGKLTSPVKIISVLQQIKDRDA